MIIPLIIYSEASKQTNNNVNEAGKGNNKI